MVFLTLTNLIYYSRRLLCTKGKMLDLSKHTRYCVSLLLLSLACGDQSNRTADPSANASSGSILDPNATADANNTSDSNSTADANTTAPNASDPNSSSTDTGTETTLTVSGITVYGTLRKAKENNERVILLFHSEENNKHEFDSYQSNLTLSGYDTLAIDMRSGAKVGTNDNKTVSQAGTSIEFRFVETDVRAAIDWAETQSYSTIVILGSSLAASVAIKVARSTSKIDALVVFSPSQYLGTEKIYTYVGQVFVPFFAAAPSDERLAMNVILNNAVGSNVTKVLDQAGSKGVALLDNETVFKSLLTFLRDSL